jgi:tetratricopeptide (TPR) repeat protein
MNCEEFNKHIDDYFLDPDFDWKLRYEMDDHLLECEKCQKIYSLSSLVTNKEVMSDPIKNVNFEILTEKAKHYIEKYKYEEAIQYFKQALELKPDDKTIQVKLDEILKKVDPKIYKPPFYLSKNKKTVSEIAIKKQTFYWKKELKSSGTWELLDREGKSLFPENITFAIHGRQFLPGRLSAPATPKTEIVQVLFAEDNEIKEIIISLEYKKDKTILTIATKKK